MAAGLTRRDVLRSMAAAAGVPALARAAAGRRSVGIVGGGMSGVALAWFLDGDRDVVLFEARAGLGGNVQTVDVDIDGHTAAVDIGAQFFHPGPYPLYTALLEALGLYPAAGSHAFPATITLAAPGEPGPRFVSPALPERTWPILDPWNWDALAAFGLLFASAKAREALGGSWSRTLGEWLPAIGLSVRQREELVLPWAASLFSGSIEQARGLSARAAMVFAARALPDNLLEPIPYFVLRDGMIAVLERLVAQCATVEVLTGAAVQRVARPAGGGFVVHCEDGRQVAVDDLVIAASGPATLRLLGTLPGTELQRAALGGIQFHAARLALHTDPIYAPPHPATWSFLNCRVQGAFCEASMWMERVLPALPRAAAGRIWKSWITHRDRLPSEILHEAQFQHMLPTPATLGAQTVVRLLQGRDGLWFAGGYLFPYDAQETALRSALAVALRMSAATARVGRLAAVERGAGAGG